MLGKRQIVTMASIATISFLIGTTISFVAATDGNPFDKIWQAVNDLQARVTSLEESANTKTWHFVTSFTLAVPDDAFPGKVVSPNFSIQGERWRIRWERVGALRTTGWAGFIACDENGNVIDAFQLAHGVPVMDGRYPARGIYYVHQGAGSYYIELHNMGADGISFSIESYH